ncbi:MAG: AI-2E family transporter [Planctomycetota bacterium]
MARIVSLVVLVVIVIGIAVLFYRVMADFLLPLFLAVLLVVIFGPLFRWYLSKCNNRHHVAAGLTTITILLIILIPLGVVLFQAVGDAREVYENLKAREIDLSKVAQSVTALGARLNLDLNAKTVEENLIAYLQEYLGPAALETVQVLGRVLLGTVVMIFSVYFFFADGPVMIQTVMRLSPLDDRYERQLIDQFADLSRTVVLATLAAALAQGVLAGIGFYFAGVGSVFLLMVLTMLLAMVPFIGAVSVWVPVCFWLYFAEGRLAAALILGVYCAAIVSTVDNLIKPLILHGRAKLHPLLALLGVLGGVQALGPIGIFVGPMVVVFLQTLLNMLRQELETLSADNASLPVTTASASPAAARRFHP